MEYQDQQQKDIIETVEKQLSSSYISSSESDSSFDYKKGGKTKSSSKKQSEQNGEVQKKSKQGLKYAKISNKQRQALVDKVTSTGCTIKSAAKELNINFSTAKAIMQIFRREGRITKKIVRDSKVRIPEKPEDKERDEGQQKELAKSVKVEAALENNETSIYQFTAEARHQAMIIQQLQTQNVFLQNKVNQLQQDKLQLNQQCEFLMLQCHQLQQYTNRAYLPQTQYPQPMYSHPHFTK